MGRHMERVGIARSDRLVLARDLQRFPFAPRHIVGVDEIVHGARVVRIPLVYAEEDFGGPVGMRSGNRIRGSGGQVRQGVECGRFGVIREGGVNLFHGLFPPSDAEPVVRRCRFEEERLRRSRKEPFPLRRWLKGLGLLHGLPPPLERFGSRPRRPERLKQGHRDAGCCDSLECLPCLWIRHVMQEGNRLIELHLSLFRAGDGEVSRTQGVAGMVLDLASRFVREASKRDDYQTDSEAQEDTTKGAFH